VRPETGFLDVFSGIRFTLALTPALGLKSRFRIGTRRGRIIRRVLSHAICRIIVRPTANDTESVTAMTIEKWSGNVTMRSLFPGQRAGVRASVNAHSIANVREPVTRVKSAGWAGCKKRVATTGCLRKAGPKRKSAFFSNVFAKLTKCNNFLLDNNDANLGQ